MENIEEASQVDCKKLVEDHWRSSLSFAAAGSIDLAKECVIRFEERIQEMAEKMPEQAAKQFMAEIERERNLVFDEYTLSPQKLKSRLGVAQPQPAGCLGVIVLFAVVPILYGIAICI